MVAVESASSTRLRRGIVPSGAVRPAFWLTATRVPTLSNTSTNRKTKTISTRARPRFPFRFRAAGMSRRKAVEARSPKL